MNAEFFTDAEIQTRQKGVTGAALLVAASDSRFFDTFKEADAMAKHFAAARKSSGSTLIRRLADPRGTGFGLTRSMGEIETGTLDALRSATRILADKAPGELDAYLEFVLGLARSVASAAGGGELVEASTIGRIETALSCHGRERDERGLTSTAA